MLVAGWELFCGRVIKDYANIGYTALTNGEFRVDSRVRSRARVSPPLSGSELNYVARRVFFLGTRGLKRSSVSRGRHRPAERLH